MTFLLNSCLFFSIDFVKEDHLKIKKEENWNLFLFVASTLMSTYHSESNEMETVSRFNSVLIWCMISLTSPQRTTLIFLLQWNSSGQISIWMIFTLELNLHNKLFCEHQIDSNESEYKWNLWHEESLKKNTHFGGWPKWNIQFKRAPTRRIVSASLSAKLLAAETVQFQTELNLQQ